MRADTGQLLHRKGIPSTESLTTPILSFPRSFFFFFIASRSCLELRTLRQSTTRNRQDRGRDHKTLLVCVEAFRYLFVDFLLIILLCFQDVSLRTLQRVHKKIKFFSAFCLAWTSVKEENAPKGSTSFSFSSELEKHAMQGEGRRRILLKFRLVMYRLRLFTPPSCSWSSRKFPLGLEPSSHRRHLPTDSVGSLQENVERSLNHQACVFAQFACLNGESHGYVGCLHIQSGWKFTGNAWMGSFACNRVFQNAMNTMMRRFKWGFNELVWQFWINFVQHVDVTKQFHS